MHFLLHFLLHILLFATSLGGYGQAPSVAHSVNPVEEPILQPGMELSIRFSGIPAADFVKLCGTYKVSGAGTIKFPKLDKPLHAAGFTFREFQGIVETAYLEAEIYKQITVVLPQICSDGGANVITIGGEVHQPQEIIFRPGLTLRSAIAQVGGVTKYADLKRVIVHRKMEVLNFDLRSESKDNPALQVRDQIVVRGR